MVDPEREANRLAGTIPRDTGFIVFLGLGGGFAPIEALKLEDKRVLAIDFNKDAAAELFSNIDYSALMSDSRFSLLIDPSAENIKNFILENYIPSLHGGVKTIPLRARTELDPPLFDAAVNAIQEAISEVAGDYSVQAHFGTRWFSNIIRNIHAAEKTAEDPRFYKIPSAVNEAAIVAAGPSLDHQLSALSERKSRGVFIISSDTALPALLKRGIPPDAVVSIDCQHFSLYHFFGGVPRGVPLILDIASPPPLCRLHSTPLFFLSGHPLARYIGSAWRPFPEIDTSGGNVTYACLSLAEKLGAGSVTLFGADFAYIGQKTYARGTYIYPYFAKRQNRFSTMEALLSSFLYRSPFLPKKTENQNYRETSSLCFYREKLEEKAKKMDAVIRAMEGDGAPIKLPEKKQASSRKASGLFPEKRKAKITASQFLEQYRSDIACLPVARAPLDGKNALILSTILPAAAAIKLRNNALSARDLIEKTKQYCVRRIDDLIDNLS